MAGETIHCLMRAASEDKLTSKGCEGALRSLMRQVDVAQDWRVDPVLQKNCEVRL